MKKAIEFEVYEVNGKPVCVKNVGAGEVCEFCRVRTFGTEWVCVFPGESIRLWEYDENSYLKPHDECPLHSGKV